ncbi:MAG: glycerate kinase [Phycisphaeraceae bacterium]
MRIIAAPDSFKEAISAADAARAIAAGCRRAAPDVDVDTCPVADGGEGTVNALVTATAGRLRHTTVAGPLNDPVRATWGRLGQVVGQPSTAVIELAAASGLPLVPVARRNPAHATTYGTGQLIKAALDAGAERIILGIGGSATNDGGAGAAQALGVGFIDDTGSAITQPLTAAHLPTIARIDLSTRDPRLRDTKLVVACDVTNPLLGADGAAAVYGPQKGATPAQIPELDRALAHLADLIERDVGLDVRHTPGAGAAGGMGAAALALLGGKLERGVELVLEAVDFHRRVAAAELCITGEGKLDGQSLSGKAVAGVTRAAARHHVPTVALVGAVGEHPEALKALGLESWHVLAPDLPAAESIRRTGELLEAGAYELVRRHLARR